MQLVANGLIEGLLVSVLGIAFALSYWSSRVFSLTVAVIYVLSPYLLWETLKTGMAWPLALTLTLALACLTAVLFDELIHRPLFTRGASPEVHLIASLGGYLISVESVTIFWGSDTKVFEEQILGGVHVGSVQLAGSQLVGGIASVLAVSMFFTVIVATNWGLRYRALSANPSLLALLGQDTILLLRVASMISAILVVVVAIARATDVGFHPQVGFPAILLALTATIVGGRNSFLGVMLASLSLGMLRMAVTWFLSARWQEGITLALLFLFLLARPQGMMGARIEMEAD